MAEENEKEILATRMVELNDELEDYEDAEASDSNDEYHSNG